MRTAILVKPGSARPGAGGEHDGTLVARVSARAVDGKATEAAVAGSFGVRRSAVRLVSGASSRTKVIDINAGGPRVLAALLAAPGRLRRGKMLQSFGRRLRAAAQRVGRRVAAGQA
jgi:hypothetical protein